MKKIILLALTALMMVGCEYKTSTEIEKNQHLMDLDAAVIEFKIIVIDSCEYLMHNTSNARNYFCHKGNCRFCKERRQKELKDIVE